MTEDAESSARITYQVILSADGKHQVSVTTESADEATKALGWAQATFDRLVERYNRPREWSRKDVRSDASGEPPVCPIHGLPMIRQKGRLGYFWSCHQRNAGGGWCSYKPEDR